MKTKSLSLIMQNKVFVWIALVTGFILLIPLMAMQFGWRVTDPGSSTKDGVNWSLFDFVAMGSLLFGTGSIFILAARRVNKKYRGVLGLVFMFVLLYLWAELAVGIFTKIGN